LGPEDLIEPLHSTGRHDLAVAVAERGGTVARMALFPRDGDHHLFMLAMALIRIGEPDRAESLVGRIRRRKSEDALIEHDWLDEAATVLDEPGWLAARRLWHVTWLTEVAVEAHRQDLVPALADLLERCSPGWRCRRPAATSRQPRWARWPRRWARWPRRWARWPRRWARWPRR
jgi:hypothetical protein